MLRPHLRRLAVVLLLAGGVAAAVFVLVGGTRNQDQGAGQRDVALTAATTTGPRVFYVSASGSDGNAGTEKRPWLTIQKALDRLRPGDAIFVRAGTYPQTLTMARDGTSTGRVTLRAFPGEHPVITGRLKVTADYATIAGLVFRGQTAANAEDVLIYVSAADHVRISRNEITEAALSGIFVGEGSDDVRIVRNWIHRNGRNDFLDHGIYFERGSGAVIAENVVESNAAYGIHLYPNADNVTVTQNTVVGNFRSGIIVGGETETSDGNLIVNNIAAFNGEQGIRTYWGGPVGAGNVVWNNVVFENRAGELNLQGVEDRDNVTANPGFVDAEAGDYHLTETSPAVDGALAEFSLDFDYEGRARPRGLAGDIGAYER